MLLRSRIPPLEKPSMRKQHVVVLSVSFDLTLTGDDLPPVHITG